MGERLTINPYFLSYIQRFFLTILKLISTKFFSLYLNFLPFRHRVPRFLTKIKKRLAVVALY
jgi:hypothetical protein